MEQREESRGKSNANACLYPTEGITPSFFYTYRSIRILGAIGRQAGRQLPSSRVNLLIGDTIEGVYM